MNSLTYFYINNQKFNYSLEFQNNHVNSYWKHNAPLIEYCETLGITIPHYCYHKNLSISGNCRMCLVELKNSPKPMVSCAMSAKSCLNNSEIFTDSPLVKKARENILEFLLLNHPLDCPICDQGGECDLQDQSLYFGISKKRFYNFKRIVTDKNIGTIVKTVMTRCIHCTRCVRFSAEVAGTEDLGMFGRGLDSEIGTYVSKSFQSELSGNVIDLCPVGALTSKPYPFLSRSWELKTTNSVDFSDGFGVDLQVSLKNNQVIKITPNYDLNSKTNPWISDKARFSFDGMFSPARVLKGFVHFGAKKSFVSPTWKILLDEVVTTLYFQDHLSNHFLKNNKLIIVFSNNISLEVLNLIHLFSKKYSFIELRKFEGSLPNNSFESCFLMGDNKLNLEKSTLCLLIGIYSRYENINLNLNLRDRYSKGNFKVLTLGSSKNLTFPSQEIGINIKTVQELAEGNNRFCQDLVNSKKPVINIGSSNLDRKDSRGVMNLLTSIKKTLNKYHSNWDNLNIVSASLNEAGVNYLNHFKTISEKDLITSNGLYFLNTHPNPLNFQKLAKLKLLNYTNSQTNYPAYCFEQNTGIKSVSSDELSSYYNPYNYINLPNGSFFESTNTFLNTEGVVKKTVKFISTNTQTKEDWQIVRKLFTNTAKISFLTNSVDDSVLSFNNKNFSNFKKYISYIFTATNTIDNKITNLLNIKTEHAGLTVPNSFKNPVNKITNTKLKIWLNDFYVGGLDPYSRYSATMINCSKSLRLDKNNFSHLI